MTLPFNRATRKTAFENVMLYSIFHSSRVYTLVQVRSIRSLNGHSCIFLESRPVSPTGSVVRNVNIIAFLWKIRADNWLPNKLADSMCAVPVCCTSSRHLAAREPFPERCAVWTPRELDSWASVPCGCTQPADAAVLIQKMKGCMKENVPRMLKVTYSYLEPFKEMQKMVLFLERDCLRVEQEQGFNTVQL